MALSPRAIALQGIGSVPRLVAVQGLWPAAPANPPISGGGWSRQHDDHDDKLRKRLIEDDETLIFAIAAWAASRRLN